MTLSRRSFLTAGAVGAVGMGLPGLSKAEKLSENFSGTAQAMSKVKGRPKLCISTYSLLNFSNEPDGISNCIKTAADLGIDAVDVLHRSMPDWKSVV